jgi:hypothetical protein
VSRAIAGLVLLLSGPLLAAWNAAGTVKNTSGTALAGVSVSVSDTATIKVTSGTDGSFSIGSTTGLLADGLFTDRLSIGVEGNLVRVQGIPQGPVSLSLLDVDGRTLWTASTWGRDGLASAALPSRLPVGSHFLRVRHTEGVFYQGVVVGAQGLGLASRVQASRSLAAFPILKFQKAGYRDTTYTMTAATQTGIAVVMADTGKVVTPPTDTSFVEDHKSECTLPTLPAASALTTNAAFPNPFKMADGTAITTKAQWKCKVEEVRAQIEKYVMGDKMRNATVAATMSGTKMAIVISAGGKSVTLNVTVTKPSGAGPFPAIIGYGGGNINGYSGLAVATINYSPFDVASEGSGRGKGLYYDLYGSSATAGELMAWAWGVSRIIDAVAANPSFGIDAKHIAVTGCSRYGKGAFMAGVMDQRIKLTIPQESGSGGVAAWRLIPVNSASQPISSTASEQYWLRADFPNTFNSAPGKLPFDNHETVAMTIPNGMLILDNGIDWLGPMNGYGSAVAGLEIYKAMGHTEALTYTLDAGSHTHCSQPSDQDHWVKSYVQKYLLGGAGETAKIEAPSTATFDKTKWIDWTTPTLQ